MKQRISSVSLKQRRRALASPIHAGYPEPRGPEMDIPIAARSLPLCYAFERRDHRTTAHERTYNRARVTCRTCEKILQDYGQLPAVLKFAQAMEDQLN